MNYKKYVLFLLLTLVLGFNKIYAEECYYISDNFSASYNTSTHDVYVNKAGERKDTGGDKEDILNDNKAADIGAGLIIEPYTQMNKCPKYLIINYDNDYLIGYSYDIYATDDEEIAAAAAKIISRFDEDIHGYYSPLQPNIKEEEYIKKRFVTTTTNNTKKSTEVEEVDYEKECESLFGDINDAGSFHYDEKTNKKVVDRPASIRYLVNQVLTYVRIIVPIIILVLGSIDFAKAMLAGKEDEMKKAQKTFIMRLVAGVLVFMAPMIVNVVMSLAEIVWEGLGYNTCGLQ